MKGNRMELSPVSFIERAGLVHASRPAVVDGAVQLSWADFRIRARKLASAIRLSGLRKGGRVAFVALNSEPLLLAHFAVPMAGGVLVAINTRLVAAEVATIVEHSGAGLIFWSPPLAELVSELPEGVRPIQLNEEFERFLATGSDAPIDSWLESEDEGCAIDYTSGTYGM